MNDRMMGVVRLAGMFASALVGGIIGTAIGVSLVWLVNRMAGG